MDQQAQHLSDDDPWGGAVAGASVREVVPFPVKAPEDGAEQWAEAVRALGDLTAASRELDAAALPGAAWQQEQLQAPHVAALIAQVQDVRRNLAATEAALVRSLGRDEMAPREGMLPDGRRWTVKRGATRKAWDHATWQHDVRKALVERFDGDVYALLADVQAAHGAGAPRTTALRALGLDPDDYCESVPGSFGLAVDGPAE